MIDEHFYFIRSKLPIPCPPPSIYKLNTRTDAKPFIAPLLRFFLILFSSPSISHSSPPHRNMSHTFVTYLHSHAPHTHARSITRDITFRFNRYPHRSHCHHHHHRHHRHHHHRHHIWCWMMGWMCCDLKKVAWRKFKRRYVLVLMRISREVEVGGEGRARKGKEDRVYYVGLKYCVWLVWLVRVYEMCDVPEWRVCVCVSRVWVCVCDV